MIEKNLSRRVLLFSGKRKTGKDHLTEYLLKYLRENGFQEPTKDVKSDLNNENCQNDVVILRISGPLKKCYAENHGLDFETLLSAGAYKEKHRLDMIKWSEEIRYEILSITEM